jgi:hypothetical protein
MSYIPAKEADFVVWSANLIAVSKAHLVELGLPEDKLTAIETLHNRFVTLHEKCKTAASSKLDMEAKHEARGELTKMEEVFVRNNLQNNDKMTNQIRREAGIPIYDNTPTHHPKPETIPDVVVRTPIPRVIQIRFRALNAPRWGKPAHVHGLECLWVIADAPPSKVAELLHSAFATKNPLELTFDENDRGKRVYFAVRWESGTVKKGAWSEILSAVIP